MTDQPITVTQADEDLFTKIMVNSFNENHCKQLLAAHRTAHAPSQHSELADKLESWGNCGWHENDYPDAMIMMREAAIVLRQTPDTARRDALISWLRVEANLRGKADSGDNRETAFSKSHAETLIRRIADAIERGDYTKDMGE